MSSITVSELTDKIVDSYNSGLSNIKLSSINEIETSKLVSDLAIQQAEQNIVTLQTSNETTQQNILTLQTSNIATQQNVATLQTSNIAAQQNVATLQASNEAAQQNIATLQASKAASDAMLQSAEASIASLQHAADVNATKTSDNQAFLEGLVGDAPSIDQATLFGFGEMQVSPSVVQYKGTNIFSNSKLNSAGVPNNGASWYGSVVNQYGEYFVITVAHCISGLLETLERNGTQYDPNVHEISIVCDQPFHKGRAVDDNTNCVHEVLSFIAPTRPDRRRHGQAQRVVLRTIE